MAYDEFTVRVFIWASLGSLLAPLAADSASRDTDFFEKKIRPLLSAKCYVCHSAGTVASGGLALDSKTGLLKGGGRGPAIFPGEAGRSLLIRAISYEDPALAMPPTGKLSRAEIADLTAWVDAGAPDPRTGTPAPAVQSINYEQGRRFWAFQPLQAIPPPQVRLRSWPKTPIDRFVLARLEEKRLAPAPPADKRTLLRRVTFDLTGLPPTPRELDDFLADSSPRAFDKVVDRLLASPHYGERWARHWLDLMRFAETTGHEFDTDRPESWRYRDYLIRAFNEDLPYDRFLREHLAGDILDPRSSPTGAFLESPVATTMLALGEERNAADDVEEVRAEKIENQIDVFGKAFLGLTVACARCHDHKFDPISTADYYGLYGIFDSTQIAEGAIDSPAFRAEIDSIHQRIARFNHDITGVLRPALAARAAQVSNGLRAAAAAIAANSEGDASLQGWVAALKKARQEPDHILYSFAVLAESSDRPFAERLAELRAALSAIGAGRPGDEVFEDFEKPGFPGWQVNGAAFGEGPVRDLPPNQALAGHQITGVASSFGAGANELTGSLVSRSFQLTKPFVHVRAAYTGEAARRREAAKVRLNLVFDGRPAVVALDAGPFLHWKTTGLKRQLGGIGYFEIVDRSRQGHIVVDKIVFSDSREPPPSPPNRLVLGMLEGPIASLDELASAYQNLFTAALEQPEPDREARWLAAALTLDAVPEELADSPLIAELRKQRHAAQTALPESQFALLAREDTPRDAAIHVRGDHHKPGDRVPRRFLRVFDGPEAFHNGSGRLELAATLLDRAPHLAARVMVNRLWKHHFGEGLVRSVDNFGRTGEWPSHPELLDYLAQTFVDGGWSFKALHRMILLSSAYRMSSQPSPRAAQIDPDNRLLHHVAVRRLEAEAIRDAILAVSGSLDAAMYGPGIVPHISPYQDGRGKPESGPLDGASRRSIYIQVRRNFLTPMLLAFDYPLPVSTIGRRGVSTVPSQPLILMNNEFVGQQAQKWAERILAGGAAPDARITSMFVSAFARPPLPAEVAEVKQFLAGQAERRQESNLDSPVLWADLAHVLINAKEFIFVR